MGTIRDTIDKLQQEIEALEQHRGDLLRAIDILEPLAVGEEAVETPARGRGGKKRKGVDPLARIKNVNRKYDAAYDDNTLLPHLKEPIKLADLAKALKAKRPLLKKALVRLKDAGLVVVVGRARAAAWHATKKGAATPRGNL